MRLISVFRDGDCICAMIGPDWVSGLGGFGKTVPETVCNLAAGFAKHDYELRANRVGVEVAGQLMEEVVGPGQAPADAIRALADRLEEDGYTEANFPEPDSPGIRRTPYLGDRPVLQSALR